MDKCEERARPIAAPNIQPKIKLHYTAEILATELMKWILLAGNLFLFVK